MNLLLQTETFLKNNLTDEEVLYMLILSRGCSIEKAQESLLKKGFITQDGNIFADYRITKAGVDAVNAVVLDSDKKIPTKTDKELRELASDLITLFPKGYQQGNRYPWRMSPSAAVERLRSFFLKFNNDYTFDEIREATKRYVEHYKDSGQMRTMIYFIWNIKNGSYDSPLANEIELLRSGAEPESNDWQNTMV